MSNTILLSKIFQNTKNRANPCFVREIGDKSWNDFECDVAHAVGDLLDKPQKKWLLFCDDVYWFTVGFTALIYASKDIILPPNMQQGTLNDMENEVDAALSDRPSNNLRIPFISLKSSPQQNKKLNIENYSDVCVTLKTSGTTGVPKHIQKTVSCLEAEVYKLDEKWKLSAQEIMMISTVSHYHIYGLLYLVIWPLMSGLSVYCDRIDYPEQFSNFDERSDCILISSPAFLKRWQNDLSHCKAPAELKMIFSSGGKLPTFIGRNLSEMHSVPVYEIYGSTETGGIATRKSGIDKYWTKIDGVSLRFSSDQLLEVSSDHTGSTGWITMGDQVVFHDEDQFSIVGRADRIEKVEEKRLSLDEMEQHLLSMSEIKDVRVEVLRQESRDLVGVAAVLSDLGMNALSSIGKRQMTLTIRDRLKAHYEAVVLPRKWRFIENIPCNSQGKISQKSILELFNNSVLPIITNINYDDDKLLLDIHVPEKLGCFEGHFDDKPVLPGVVQIDWASHYAFKYFNVGNKFSGAEALKFINIITPGLNLKLEFQMKNNKIVFYYRKDDTVYSSGRLLLGNVNE